MLILKPRENIPPSLEEGSLGECKLLSLLLEPAGAVTSVPPSLSVGCICPGFSRD